MQADSERDRQEILIAVLRKVAPGTEMREAVDRSLQGEKGALIVVGDLDELRPIMSGGFNINCEFTAPRLYELAKMDGAVIVSEDLQTIISANVHLVPDPTIPSSEAGMRHRTAERVAKQTGAFVVAISEKMKSVSIYIDNEHFTLERIPLVLAKADQALQTLSRYRTRLDREFGHLNALEIEDMVTLRDVVKVVQRTEMVIRMAEEVRFQVSELGKDGRLVSLQLNELMAGVDRTRSLLIKDYYVPRDETAPEDVIKRLEHLMGDELMEETSVPKALGYRSSMSSLNNVVSSRGYRLLSAIPSIPGNVIEKVVVRFDNLKNILRASPALLDEVDGVGERRALAIKEGLNRIAEFTLGEGYI